jgi:glycosyltransferase involved in cell wall biosynthesis
MIFLHKKLLNDCYYLNMRRIYNLGANIPFIGLFLEIFLLTMWLFLIRIKPNNREPNFTKSSISGKSKSGKKIIINCRNFLRPEHSGVNVWVESICHELRDNHEVTILCQGLTLFSTETFIHNDIEIKCLPVFNNLRIRKLPLHSAWMESVNKEIKKIIDETILITPMNLAAPYGLTNNEHVDQIVLLLTDDRRHRYPKLTIQQIKNEIRLTKRQTEIVRREKSILQNPRNSFIADSNAIVKELEVLYEVTMRSRTQINYIDVGQDLCDEREKEKIVLFIGRCDSRKGLNIYLDVYEELKNEFSNWNFLVATSKGDDEKTFKRLQKLGVKESNLKILLNVKNEEKHRILNMSAITLLPSYYESFGITGLEAMQHGCALISSRIGGIPEVVQNGGILVNPGSAQDFARELREIMLSEQKLILLSESAKLQVLNLMKKAKASSILSE